MERTARTLMDTSLDLEYEDLPLVIKHEVTQKEFRWMLQAGRDRLIQEMTEPEAESDS